MYISNQCRPYYFCYSNGETVRVAGTIDVTYWDFRSFYINRKIYGAYYLLNMYDKFYSAEFIFLILIIIVIGLGKTELK